MNTTRPRSTKGLRQFLSLEQQRDWIEGRTTLRDADERSESLEQRFKYSVAKDRVDEAFLEQCVTLPEEVSYILPLGEDIFVIKVRGAASIRKFIENPRALRAIRTFNLTHMNRGRNAYQASHCFSVADYMLDR